MPNLADPNFTRTLTLICEHSDEGAIGFILNRPIDIAVHELFLQQHKTIQETHSLYDDPLYLGGPLEQDHGFVLHSTDKRYESSMAVNDFFCVTASVEIFDDIVNNKGPEKNRFMLGYAGWSPGQLEAEIADNAWLTTEASADIVFDLPDDQQWQAAALSMGVDMSLINAEAGHA